MGFYDDMIKNNNCNENIKEKKVCKEICSCDKLYLDECTDSLTEVVEGFMKIIIKDYKTIKTHCGSKIIIKGQKLIKILYKSKDKCGSLKSECFTVPFCKFISVDYNDITVCGIKANVEYFEAEKCTSTSFIACSLFEICAFIKTNHCHNDINSNKDRCTADMNSLCDRYENVNCELILENDEIEYTLDGSKDFEYDEKVNNFIDWFPVNK